MPQNPKIKNSSFKDRVKTEEDEEAIKDSRVETIKFYLVQNEPEKVKKLLKSDGEGQVHTFVLE